MEGSDQERTRVNAVILDLLAASGLDLLNATSRDRAELARLTQRPAAISIVGDPPRWTTLEREGISIGVLPLGDFDSARLDSLLGDHVRTSNSPPASAAIRIALTSSVKTDPVQLLGAIEGIDILIVARGDTNHRRPDRVGDALVVYAPAEGQALGSIHVDLHGSLTEEWLSLFEPKLTDRAVAERIRDLNDELQAVRKAEAASRTHRRKDARWIGVQACGACHAKEMETWSHTGHAHAMATLVTAGKDFDPDCLRCHVTAWKDGYQDPLATPELADVQCEACHGPGRAHAEQPNQKLRPVTVDTCKACHTAENSPEFDEASYRRRIRHW